MSVVDEIMAQGSHTAFRIAKDLLDRLENDLHKFAIAAVHKETIGVAKAIKGEPAEIMLVVDLKRSRLLWHTGSPSSRVAATPFHNGEFDDYGNQR